VRVAFVILDGMPARLVSAARTPTLAALAADGAGAVGRSVMTSATYPNHATFATGAAPVDHGLLANWVVHEGRPRPAYRVGPRVPTIFDACRAAKRSTDVVLGDHHLVPVMGAARADRHWPPDGAIPDGVERDGHGYVADCEVVPRLAAAFAGGADLVVGHLNEPDTAGHDHGPDSDAASAAYTATDASLGEALDALRPHWDDTVLIVVSDHDLETVDLDRPPIDLHAAIAAAGLDVLAIPEGVGAVVWGDDPSAGAWLAGVDGVIGHEEVWPGARLVVGAKGRDFALPPGIDAPRYQGNHGGAHTRDQVVVVAGGHPAVAPLAAAIRSRPPDAADWAPTIAALLGVDLPTATGRALV
jgi:arylsulfatase A-like enzyme